MLCKNLRKKWGKLLAFELGTDGRHIRRIEAGEVNPTFLTLKKIAEVLECKLTDLII